MRTLYHLNIEDKEAWVDQVEAGERGTLVFACPSLSTHLHMWSSSKRSILDASGHIPVCSRNVIHGSVKRSGFLVYSVHFLGGVGGRVPVHIAILRIVL